MIDYINLQGLGVAIDQLQTLCLTKADGAAITNAIQALAAAVVFPEFDLTIPTAGWVSGVSGEYTVYLDVAAENVTAADSVAVAVSVASLDTAKSCGLCPMVETLAGALRFRAVSAPEANITGQYRILRGPAQT